MQEIGAPELLFCFFDMVEAQPVWMTPRGAQYNSRAILRRLAKSPSPDLLARLYRCRFEPRERVREAMDALWQALVPNTNAMLAANFRGIVDELLKGPHMDITEVPTPFMGWTS